MKMETETHFRRTTTSQGNPIADAYWNSSSHGNLAEGPSKQHDFINSSKYRSPRVIPVFKPVSPAIDSPRKKNLFILKRSDSSIIRHAQKCSRRSDTCDLLAILDLIDQMD